MATKKVGQKAVKWSIIADRVHPRQKEAFNAFKTKAFTLANKVNVKPDNLPKIDFAHYKRAIADKAIVAKFEKMYGALSVPYPEDKTNMLATVHKEEETALVQKTKYVKSQQRNIAVQKDMVTRMDKLLPPFEEMTMQMFYYYFPDTCWDPRIEHQCRLFPQNRTYGQPDFTHDAYARRVKDKGGFTSISAYEYYWQEVFDKQQKEKKLKDAKMAALKAANTEAK